MTRASADTPIPADIAHAQDQARYSSLENPGQSVGISALAAEVALSIAYNGLSHSVMMVSPLDLEDFVVGFTLTAGLAESPDDLYDVQIEGEGEARRAEVNLSNRAFWQLKQQRRQLAGNSGCGLCGVEALEQALPELESLPAGSLPRAEWFEGLRQKIGDFQVLGRHCGAVHAALFMDGDGTLRLGREDIGRHNALDKLIGALVRQKIDASAGVAIVTSRCSLELIHKVVRAGIPTLASLSAPTALAVQWAQRHALNLIHLPQHSPPRVYSAAGLARR
ncbi:formate dehydrogenase accessory sulfurtransferase FdhD [Stutzerimonas nosocomialis]|uniref:formate dehydrogenase accessory sulfurtransferase FdhD n=1 Tax=Stutzerimonas nosocomialis TaxID=1056496 RepID=UPI00110945A8|nr:formate dehydrogenase accessory sulfurtransferase FdhD [Stutzerimonas nosocomialis]